MLLTMTMNCAPLLLSILVSFSSSLACARNAEQPVATATSSRQVAAFTSLSVDAPVDVELSIGSAHSLRVECDPALAAHLQFEQTAEKLRIVADSSFRDNDSRRCKVTLTAPQLQALALRGSGDIHVHHLAQGLSSVSLSGSGDIEIEALRSDSAGLAVSGSGELRIRDLQVEKLHAVSSGSGDLEIAGTAAQTMLIVSGSSNLEARSLTAQRADVNVTGSGDAELTVKESVNVLCSGSGDVTIYGNPKQKRELTAGSGSVRYRG